MEGFNDLTDDDLDKMSVEQLESLKLQTRPPESFTDDELDRMPAKQLATLKDQLMRKKYAGEIGAAKAQYAMNDRETTPHRVARAVVGVLHAPASSYVYNRSIERLRNDQADESDFRNIAIYEGQQAQDEQRSGAAQLGLAVAQIPGEVATMVGGGMVAKAGLKAAGIASKAAMLPATVAATPTMWAAQGVQRNVEEGRDSFSPTGFAAAGAHATAKLAALELVGGVTGQMLPGWLKDSSFVKSVASKVGEGPMGKAALGGVSGPFTQAAADVLTSVVGIDEGYGSIGLAFQGKYGEAAQHVVIDALTFAAFAAMHGKSGKKVFEDLGGKGQKAEAPPPEDTPPGAEDPNAPKGRHYRARSRGRTPPTGGEAGGQAGSTPPPESPGGGPPPGSGARERWWKQFTENTRKYAEDLLGVGRDFTESDLRSAFGAKAREFHPDTAEGPDAASKFQEAKAAYEHLKRYAKKNPPPPPPEGSTRPGPEATRPEPEPTRPEPTPADGTEALQELMKAETPAATEPAPRQFKTAKGSVYDLHEDGTTTRTKSLHEGHETTDVGVKPRSEKTVYVSEEDARAIGLWNSASNSGKRLLVQGDHALLTSINEATGKRGKDGAPIKLATEPAVGLHPLELTARSKTSIVEGAETWKGNHPGNAITELTDRPAEAKDPAAAMKEYIAPEPTRPEPVVETPAAETPPPPVEAPASKPSLAGAKGLTGGPGLPGIPSKPSLAGAEGLTGGPGLPGIPSKPSLAERMKARGRIGLKEAAPKTGAADASIRSERAPEPPPPPEPPKPKVSAFRQKQLDTERDRIDFIREQHAQRLSLREIAALPDMPGGEISYERVRQLGNKIGLNDETSKQYAEAAKTDAAERIYQSVIESREANESPAGFDPEVDITERSQADARDAVRSELLGSTNTQFAGEGGEEGEIVRSMFRSKADFAHAYLDRGLNQALRAGDLETVAHLAEMMNRMFVEKYLPSTKELKDATAKYRGKKKRAQAEITDEQRAAFKAPSETSPVAAQGGTGDSATGPGQRAGRGREAAGATSAGGRPGPGTPKQRVERDLRSWSGLKDLAREFFTDERGTIDLDVVSENIRQARMSFEKLGGVQFPRTAALSKEAATKASILAGAEQFPKAAADYFVDHIFGQDADPKFVERNTAALVELRLRRLWEVHQANADALLDANGNPPLTAKGQPTAEWKKLQKIADKVSTKVGTVFKDEADFISVISDPAFDGIYDRWANSFAKEADALYRKSRNFSPTDTVFSPTQIDGTIIPLIAKDHVRVDPLTRNRDKTKKGNLRNAKIKSNVRARMARGHGDYSVDPRQIMEEALYSQARIAAHADLVEQYVKDGIGIVGKSGAVPDIGGEPAIKTDFINRPKNYNGPHGPDQVLYLHRDAHHEYRDLIDTDRAAHIMGITPAAKWITSTQMYSAADLLSHFNALTGAILTLEGSGILGRKNLGPTYHYFRESIRNSPEIKREIMEMARLNMITFREPHAGMAAFINKVAGTSLNEKSAADPLVAGSKLLHHYDRAIRLAARDGYLRLMKERGETPNDKDMIDYVGQCLNYSKSSQNQFVRWCRDVGLGGFATAAAGNTQKSARLVLGLANKAGQGGWKMRAELLGSFVAAQAMAMAVNYMMWGDVEGDDRTPFMAIKVRDLEDGSMQWADLHPLAGMVRRGSKAVGLHALASGLYDYFKGESDSPVTDKTTMKGIHDVYEAMAHPLIGPPVESATVFLTGRNTRGYQEAKKPEDGESEVINNAVAAAKKFLPVPDFNQATDDPLSYAASWVPIIGLKTKKPKRSQSLGLR